MEEDFCITFAMLLECWRCFKYCGGVGWGKVGCGIGICVFLVFYYYCIVVSSIRCVFSSPFFCYKFGFICYGV
jgi:hypothetical protein